MWPGAASATLEEALTTALAAPQGPVWIDIPKDVQSAEI
jgi:thiamine pyrophosphate-dependent acetolactate synthase large subunit-like protein